MSRSHFTRLVLGSIFCAAIAISLLSAIPAQGQTYTVIANIPQVPGVQSPTSKKLVQGRNGDLYSTSTGGEDQAAYRLALGGTDTKVSEIFRGNDGGVTLGTDGNFYGTAARGGTGTCGFYGCGYAWKLTPSGTLTTLYSFTGNPDGGCPTTAPVQAPSGTFYGVTNGSNCDNGNNGIIYSLTKSGIEKVLHTFSGSDGANPSAPLTVGNDGSLYGGTSGGGSNNYGVLFKMTPSGAYTVLHNLAQTDGQDVESGMIQASDGNFYGVTYRGGSDGGGVVFQLTPSGGYTVLYNFGTVSGPPGTSLVEGTDGVLYGITLPPNGQDNGHIYSITKSGTFNILHTFCQDPNCTDGYNASTPLVQDTDGKFYSVTASGGMSGNCECGVFYSFDVGLGAFVQLVSTSGKEGAKVGILGQGFSGSSVVSFGGTQATTVTRSGTTFLNTTVPAGALTGTVTVTTGGTTLTSSNTFNVLPTLASFSPSSGPVGTAVQITGTGLMQTTSVTFGGVKATNITVNSDTQVTADVPTGAKTGKIGVTTKGGKATSKASFTVT
jgi:uncharacterized repeat protein (TIGR03803 family)